MKMSDLTIAIPTKGRPECLARLLGSVAAQGVEEAEILILDGDILAIDNPIVGQLLDLLETENKITYMYDTKKLPDARNFMLQNSRKWCLFVDDDVVLGPASIQAMYEYKLARSSFISLTITEIKNYLNSKDWFKEVKGEDPAKNPFGTGYTKLTVPLLLFDTTCVMLKSKDALNAGGFVEYPLEYLYLSNRMKEKGYIGSLLTRFHAWHLPSPKYYRNPLHDINLLTEHNRVVKELGLNEKRA